MNWLREVVCPFWKDVLIMLAGAVIYMLLACDADAAAPVVRIR